MKLAFLIWAFLSCANSFAESSINFMSKSDQGFHSLLSGIGTDFSNIQDPPAYALPTGLIENTRKNSNDCLNGKPVVGGPMFMKNLSILEGPFTAIACEEADKVMLTKKLDQQVCQNLASCFRAKEKLTVGLSFQIRTKSREKVASEAISLISQDGIGQMIDFEELKKYSLDKYGKDFMPKECAEDSLSIPEKVGSLNSGCMTNIIDKGYAIAQQYCKVPEAGCKPNYLDFIKDKTSENTKSSLLMDFIKKSTDEQIQIYKTNDSKIANDISKIVMTKILTPESRAEKILSYLSANYMQLDPVFKSYSEQSRQSKLLGREDEIKIGLEKMILENQELSADDAYKTIENLRMSQAKRSLKSKCANSLKMEKLCTIANDVLSGGKVTAPESSFNKMLASNNPTLSMNQSLNNIDLGEYVARCNTYILVPSIAKNFSSYQGVNLSKGKDLFTSSSDGLYSIEGFSGITGLSSNSFGFGESERPQITIALDGSIRRKQLGSSFLEETVSTSASLAFSPDKIQETVLVDIYTHNKEMPETYNRAAIEQSKSGVRMPEKISDVSDSLVTKKDDSTTFRPSSSTENTPSTQAPQSSFTKPFVGPTMRPMENTIDTPMDFSPKSENTVKNNNSGNVDYNQLLSKISGLEDKLAQAQKKSAASALDKAADTKIDSKSQEESDLLKELKNAKSAFSDLSRSNNDKEKEKEKSATELANSSTPKAKTVVKKDIVSDTSDNDVAVPTGAISKAAGRSISSLAPAARSSSESTEKGNTGGIEEGKSFGARSFTGDSSSYSIGDGIVLTRLDGVAKSKANETISSMIVAESGKPFYIEEGGMVKQIVPEVVDGKIIFNENGTPVYTTIVKGKVGEFKIDSKDKKKEKKAITKVTSPADLKMQEDKSASPAVRYRELQDILQFKK